MRLLRRNPAVSTKRNGPSSVSTTVSIASRVVPGMSCTTDAVFTDEPVEQRRLADVRTADDRDVEDAVVERVGRVALLPVVVVLVRFRQRGHDRVEQLARQPTVNRRHRHRIAETEPGELPDVGLAALVVDLVHDDDHGRVGLLQQLGDLRVLLGDARRDVDDEQHDVRGAHGFCGLRAHLGRERRLLAGESSFAFGQPAAGVDDAKRTPDPFGRAARAGRG